VVVSEPDLFVVCKNCSSEVSPYVTECPYCGQRVRKRAPKLDRGGESAEPKAPKRPRTSLPRLRRNEIPGIASDVRPYATFTLIGVSILLMLAFVADEIWVAERTILYEPLDGEYWRIFTTSFIHVHLDFDNLGVAMGYAFIALTATGVFGTLLERRFGPLFTIGTFVLAGAGGAALALLADDLPTLGANGAALGLLCAWLVDDWLARRRGNDRENDLLGVYVFMAVLFLLSVAEPDASVFAAVGGAGVGAVMGAIASPFRP
jgi:membrane associated rhomboid family serine protease